METRNAALWVLATRVLLITCAQGQGDRGLQAPRLHTRMSSKQVVYFSGRADVIHLGCLVVGTSTPTYQWKRTMEVGTPEERTEIITPSNMFALRKGHLKISNPVVNNITTATGLYQCFASNDRGTTMSGEVDVKYAFLGNFPPAPVQNMSVSVGQHATLRCTGAPNSDPAPTYNWLKETGVIKRTSRIAVGLDDPPNRLPTIGYHTPEVVGMLGEKAVFQCIPDGNPIPDIIWQNQPHGRHRVDDFTRVLSIFDVSESDEGLYTCQANSSGGLSGKTTINLKVRSQPIWMEKPRVQIVPEGETATFRCKARGTQSDREPVLTQWYKDGVKLRSGVNDPNIYVQGAELSVQHLEKAKHNIMTIQCTVKNSWGSDIVDASLNVIIPTKVLVFPKDVLLDEDNPVAKFKVNAEVDPLKTSDVKYIWKTPAGDVVTSTNSNDAIYLGFDGTLVVNTTKMSSQEYKGALGNYTCTVTVGVPGTDILIYVVLTSSDQKATSEVDTSLNIVAVATGASVSLLGTIIVIVIVCVILKRHKSRKEISNKSPAKIILSDMPRPPPAHTDDDNYSQYEEINDRYLDIGYEDNAAQPFFINQNDCPGSMNDTTGQASEDGYLIPVLTHPTSHKDRPRVQRNTEPDECEAMPLGDGAVQFKNSGSVADTGAMNDATGQASEDGYLIPVLTHPTSHKDRPRVQSNTEAYEYEAMPLGDGAVQFKNSRSVADTGPMDDATGQASEDGYLIPILTHPTSHKDRSRVQRNTEADECEAIPLGDGAIQFKNSRSVADTGPMDDATGQASEDGYLIPVLTHPTSHKDRPRVQRNTEADEYEAMPHGDAAIQFKNSRSVADTATSEAMHLQYLQENRIMRGECGYQAGIDG